MEFLAELGHRTRRDVVLDDAIMYLEDLDDDSIAAGVYTSLPDISEVPEITTGYQEADRYAVYKDWFTDVAALIFRKLANDSWAIFLQSDVRVIYQHHSQVDHWLDKSHLLARAADREGCKLMWHKICMPLDKVRRNNVSTGRPQYSHLLCFAKGLTASYRSGAFAAPDVFDRGEMLWPRGIGLDCAFLGLTFLKEVAGVRSVLDPFCGVGTVVALANAMGLDSTGVEVSAKRVRKAKRLDLRTHLARMDVKRRVLLGHDPKRFPLVLPSPDSPTNNSDDLGPRQRPAAGLDSSDDEPDVADEDDDEDGDIDVMARNEEEDRKRRDDDSYRSSPGAGPSPGFGVGAGAKQGWRRAGSEGDDDSPVSRGGGLGVGALALPLRGESKTDNTGRRWRDDYDDYDDDEDDTTVEHGGRLRLRRHDVSRNNSEEFGAAEAMGARRGLQRAYSRDGTSPESVGSNSMGRGGGESNHREFKYYRGVSPPGLTLPLSPESPMEPPLMRRGRDDEEDDEGKTEPPLMRRGGDADDEPPLMRRRSDGDEDEEEEVKAEPPLARRERDDHDDHSDDDDGRRDAEAKASGDAPRRPQPRPPSNDLFLDFDASVTEGGAPSDNAPSSSSSSAARATAAAAFGRYQHRRRTVEDVECDDTVVQLTASPRPLPASDDEAEGGERERGAPSPRRPKPALPGGTAAEVVDKEVGDGWKGVQGLTIALKGIGSRAQRDGDTGGGSGSGSGSGTAGGGPGGDTDGASQEPIVSPSTPSSSGGGGSGGGNRARSMFANRLKLQLPLAGSAPPPDADR